MMKGDYSVGDASIFFQYPDDRSAEVAYDTLLELGYHAHRMERDGRPIVQLFVESGDLTSALEIAQASGGTMMDTSENAASEPDTYRLAYDLDSVRIPAHIVNEDLDGGLYADGAAAEPAGSVDADGNPDLFDPSGDDYDHFQAGIRL
jgi:hypothetical protein